MTRHQIPVFMLHSVNLHDRTWLYPYLSVPLPMVETLLATLRKKKIQTLFLDEWYTRNGLGQPDREIVLTFDDGYLDNWVYLYPLLEKYECRATIFVNPDFVQPGQTPRRTLADVWQKATAMEDISDLGFLNRAELGIMDASPWVDIQSHSMTHTWYFSGQRLIDFHAPKLRGSIDAPQRPWMAWNADPQEKPFSLNVDWASRVPFGSPIFENGRSLGVRRYLPDPRAIDQILAFAAEQGPVLFASPDWKRILLAEWKRILTSGNFPGRFETDEEMQARYRRELEESRAILEKKLGKRISYLCWPGGC